MILPIKLRKKRSNIKLTIDPSDPLRTVVVTNPKDLTPPPKTITRRAIDTALSVIQRANKDEVERTRQKLKDKVNETHSK